MFPKEADARLKKLSNVPAARLGQKGSIMKSKLHSFVILVIVLIGVLAQAQNAAVTLLPANDNAVTEGPQAAKGLLWLQKQEPKTINLAFVLTTLPAGLAPDDFKECTLRLVAKQRVFRPEENFDNTGGGVVLIRGWLADARFSVLPQALSIVQLSTLSEQHQPVTLNQPTSSEFKDAIYQAYSSREKRISLVLRTDSRRASSLFYSTKSFEGDPSNIPRLVITFKLPKPSLLESLSWPQNQHDPEHTGRSPWRQFHAPDAFTVEEITPPPLDGVTGAPTIVDYPLIYGGNLYVIYRYDSGNYLVCLDFTGKKKIWQAKILGNTVQRSPVISRLGFIYVVTESLISSYYLSDGKMALNYSFGKLSDFADITVGNDGSLYLAVKQDEVNYIYGYDPLLTAFLRAGPFEKGAISTSTVDAAGNKIFFQTGAGGVVIELPDPSKKSTLKLDRADSYWTPLAGPAGGVMVFADKSSKGNVEAYNAKGKIWNASDNPVAQPVLGTNELVYFLRGGQLQSHKYDDITTPPSPVDKGLLATSNLVMDGADDVYFWNNGTFYAYGPDGNQLLGPQSIKGPPPNIRLTMAPDGTLWANSTTALFAFQPKYNAQDWEIKAKELATQTTYRATGKLTVKAENAQEAEVVPESAQLLLEAGSAISFSGGFGVPKGASILCRVGK